LARLAPQLILPGRPVRGGGRAKAEGLAIDIVRLAELAPPYSDASPPRRKTNRLGSRLCRNRIAAHACPHRRAGQKLELARAFALSALIASCTLRAVCRFHHANSTKVAFEFAVGVPGELEAPIFGIRLRIDVRPILMLQFLTKVGAAAHLETRRPSREKYSSAPRKVKEVLERMKVTGSIRATWPVLEFDRRIIWMKGVDLEPEPGIEVIVTPLAPSSASANSAEPVIPK